MTIEVILGMGAAACCILGWTDARRCYCVQCWRPFAVLPQRRCLGCWRASRRLAR